MNVPAYASAGRSVTLNVPRAAPGDAVQVTGAGWPAGQLIQLTTCGQLALPGSAACDLRLALAASVRPDGGFTLTITLGDPPRPCPCVVHVAAVGTGPDIHVDAPIEIAGHAVGPLPTPAANLATVDVVETRLTGGGRLSAWFGGPQHRTLVYTVRNGGPEALVNVPITVQVGRAATPAAAPDTGQLKPGETRTYRVPVTIPFAAFGAYPVTVEIGGAGRARAVHQAYPWGLVLVNVLGLGLIAAGVIRRVRRVRSRGAGPQLALADDVLLPAVVRVPELRAYLVFDDAPGSRRLRRLAGGRVAAFDLRDLLVRRQAEPTAVVDLDALDAYLAARSEG
ncbi:hypothetical protein AB0M47_42275 [Hamadaea sp. NPDC051192]|uniref:hypothetical protein n=1 Tax=Hamadaea sp. NPDC051192 TaxID=3154940 RepID=UPI00341228DB